MAAIQTEEARLLDEAMAVVKQQTRLMLKCLETPGKLMDALKCSSTLVSELRTSSLGPKQYYELYMAVFDALRDLSVFLRESHPVNHLADLYELVQYAGNIVPRLYLMITVGTVYMGIEDAPVKEIMKDMMEMSRGVQHPIRGLFLRFYLSGQARDYLPQGSGDGPEGNLQDSVSFVLMNFVEMNKLWVRLQHQGHSREREKRIQERRELQQLVGSNLVRLSQLVDLDAYKNVILKPLLEQVVQCKDKLAQEYLLEVITQVFPDEFHLHTLDEFLSATAQLNSDVDIKAIVIGLMNRLSTFASRDTESDTPEVREEKELAAVSNLLENMKLNKDTPKLQESGPSEVAKDTATEASESEDDKKTETDSTASTDGAWHDEASTTTLNGDAADATPNTTTESTESILASVKLYEIFFEQVVNLVNKQRLPIQDTTALLVSLVNLALNIYPDRLEYVNQVLGSTHDKIKEMANSADLHSAATQKNILNLMLAPVNSYTSIFTAIALPNYLPLLQAQTYPTRRAIATSMIKTIISSSVKISTVEHAEGILEVVKVLIKEGTQQPASYPGTQQRRTKDSETEETVEEQGLLARLTHLIISEDNDVQYKLIQATKKAFLEGGDRIKYTTPALMTSCIKLARRYKTREHYDDEWQTKSQSLYKFMHQTLSALYSRVGSADLCLRLFILCGQVADQAGFEEVAYEFFAQAFTIYEEAISDSRAQFQAVCVIAGALHSTRNFTKENYDTLITKCALHGSKLLKKHDQCRAVYLASHLWWAVEIPARGEEDGKLLYRDGKRVLECLQRALRVADACMDVAVSIELFVEILNRYVYYFDHQNEAVTVKYINGLIELIHSNLGNNTDAAANESPRTHFERTLAYIASRDYEGVVTDIKG